MQHCERDCEEDEFEGHFLFFSFFLQDDGGSRCWVEGAVVVGEEEEDLGLRWIGAGNDDGG